MESSGGFSLPGLHAPSVLRMNHHQAIELEQDAGCWMAFSSTYYRFSITT
jgi:hypothetical protein